ncbi:MAG TPA: STAS domain-containing protein [Amycolatopsis sp.]|uniref:STAS domain-containing protein n=1 Tax=Amycolatopsis sp. TaxID=37632 RepID=UPI002B4592BB|nr:STAS domain-containing protein [Amycolatopsis sp.]HKS47054.1 STAS domain-containing protein [Amycolatopsis sp.]
MNERQNVPAHGGLQISTRRDGTAVVVAVAGEIDLNTAPELHSAIEKALGQTRAGACVLDLTGVTFLGSPGLTTLLEAANHAEELGEPLRIVVDATRPVIRPIEMTGLDHILSLYHAVEDALAAVRDRQDS